MRGPSDEDNHESIDEELAIARRLQIQADYRAKKGRPGGTRRARRSKGEKRQRRNHFHKIP